MKEKGRFPHFVVGRNNPVYYSLKRVYILEQLHTSGLLSRLLSSNAKTIILFGSMARGDWYKDSDIDIFVLGDISDFKKSTYERRLGRHIELHVFKDRKEIDDVKTGLIKNVINGYIVKGKIQDIAQVA